jgi:hypothetical protein
MLKVIPALDGARHHGTASAGMTRWLRAPPPPKPAQFAAISRHEIIFCFRTQIECRFQLFRRTCTNKRSVSNVTLLVDHPRNNAPFLLQITKYCPI